MLKKFSEHTFHFTDTLVILDLDGTLVADGEEGIPEATRRVVKELAAQNTVYLSSNKRSPSGDGRLARVSALLGIPTTDTRFRKPSLEIFTGIARDGKRIIVIGDKDITDGLLALRAGGEYIKVARLASGTESLPVRIVCWLDDVFGATISWLWAMCFSPSHSR